MCRLHGLNARTRSVTKLVYLLLLALVTLSRNVLAFQARHDATSYSAAWRRTSRKAPPLTALHFFNWFSSSKDGDGKDAKQDAPSVESKGALGGVAGIMDSMDSFKRSQRIGKITGALVQELRSTTVEGVAENGKVKVIYDCQQRPVSTYIDEAFFQAMDASDVAAAITSAMKDANSKSTEKMDEKMKSFFNELGLPPSN